MSFNEDYHDAIIVRQLLLNRVASGLSDRVEKVYQNIINEITEKMRTYEKINERTLKKIIRDLSLYVNPDLDFMSKELNKLAFEEVSHTITKANDIANYMLFAVVPPKDVIRSIYNTSLMAAGDRAYTVTDWYKGIDNALLNKIDGAVKMGMVQGETGIQLAERMEQLGIKTIHDAKAIALTSVSHIAHNARESVYNDNADVIKGWKSVATLDNRTSLLCASYDGAMYDFKTHKGLNDIGKQHAYFPPPRHPNCRSVHIIITKSYREMGIPIDEIDTLTRSSLDGQIPADTTFNQWISKKSPTQIKKYLGAGRYDLYKEGKITLSDLVNQRGRTLTIDELISANASPIKTVVPKIDFGYGGKFNGYVKDIKDEAKIVIDKLPKPNGMSFGKKATHNFDFTNGSTITTTDNRIVFNHEYGHHLDMQISTKAKSGTLFYSRKQLLEEYKKDREFGKYSSYEFTNKYFNENYKKVDVFGKRGKYKGKLIGYKYEMTDKTDIKARISDIYDAMSQGNIQKMGGIGHGVKYYKKTENVMAETFANMFSIWSDGEYWEDTKVLFPNITSKFELIMKDVIDGKFD